MLLFLTTNMAAVMSRAMQQFENSLKIRGSAWKFGMGFLGGLIVGPGFLWGSVGSPMSRNFFTSMFSCIRSSPSLETRSTPPPHPWGTNALTGRPTVDIGSCCWLTSLSTQDSFTTWDPHYPVTKIHRFYEFLFIYLFLNLGLSCR